VMACCVGDRVTEGQIGGFGPTLTIYAFCLKNGNDGEAVANVYREVALQYEVLFVFFQPSPGVEPAFLPQFLGTSRS
jgi:hypothetical protein